MALRKRGVAPTVSGYHHNDTGKVNEKSRWMRKVLPRVALTYTKWFYSDMFQDLKQALPGYQLETGMACAFGKLVRLAPAAAQFEPRLFTHILPTLNDEEALVIGLFIRTGNAEHAGTVKQDTSKYGDIPQKTLDCALGRERAYISGKVEPGRVISRVVWMLVTDSPELKKQVIDEYHEKDLSEEMPLEPRSSQMIKREVVVTRARGAHTKAGITPSNADFAEALIDWYLLGESDFIISTRESTFGTTAGLRTARPIYQITRLQSCSKTELVHEHIQPKK